MNYRTSRSLIPVIILLTFVSLLNLSAQADILKTTNIEDENNQIVGFIDENGRHHELPENNMSPSSNDIEDDQNILLSPTVAEPISLTSTGFKTIDEMTFSNYNDTYSNGGILYLIEDADRYYLNDGSSWRSGAGSYGSSKAYFDHVEINGTTLRFYLKNPSDFRRTDYNSGDHSAKGTLRPLTPLVIEATAGATTGKLTGAIELISNNLSNYSEPRFNFFSAPVGAVLPFEITYTLRSGATFNQNLFDNSFSYNGSGSVDFANPISVPLPISLEIKGSQKVLENSEIQYTTVATYDNGVQRNVTESTVWGASPVSLASVSEGLLITGSLTGETEIITLTAIYEYGDVIVNTDMIITCMKEGAIFPDNSWPMFQGNKEHTGYIPILLDTADFTKKWEHDFGRLINPIAAADSKVFVSTPTRFQNSDSLFVLDDRDGEVLWSKNLGAASSVNPPSYAYGNVYIQTGKGTSSPPPYVSAFDAEAGTEVFRALYSAQWESHYAPTIYKGSVYVNGGYYGGMYRYDAFGGTQKWFHNLNQYDDWTPAVDENYVYAYIGESCSGCRNAGLRIVDINTGTSVGYINDPRFDWRGWSMRLAPVIGSMNDVLVIQDGRLLSFDLVNKDIGFEILGSFIGQPCVGNDVVYAINGGSLESRSEADGALLWSWNPPEGALTGTMILTDTHVIARTGNNTYAIELLSRRQDWTYPASGHLALGNDTLYIAGSDGILTAISTPEYIPSAPVQLEIEGPTEILESSTAQYTAIVQYDDGRIRDRTELSAWTITGASIAAIDNYGVLSVDQMLYPQKTFELHVEYSEEGVTLIDEIQITVNIGCTVKELIIRNLEYALEEKQQVQLSLEQALEYERASVSVIKDLRNGDIDNISRPDLNKARDQVGLAIVREKVARTSVDKSVENLTVSLEIFSADNSYLKDMEAFDQMLSLSFDDRLQNADVNGDGEVNMLDVLEISRFWLKRSN